MKKSLSRILARMAKDGDIETVAEIIEDMIEPETVETPAETPAKGKRKRNTVKKKAAESAKEHAEELPVEKTPEEKLADLLENLQNAAAKIPRKHRRLGRGVITVFTRLCAHIHDLALLNDQHALPIRNGDHGSTGDDIIVTVVAASAGSAAFAFCRKNCVGKCLTIKIFFPLVSQNASGSTCTCI